MGKNINKLGDALCEQLSKATPEQIANGALILGIMLGQFQASQNGTPDHYLQMVGRSVGYTVSPVGAAMKGILGGGESKGLWDYVNPF